MPKTIRTTRKKAQPRVIKSVSLLVHEVKEVERAARREGLEFSAFARAAILDRARGPQEAA